MSQFKQKKQPFNIPKSGKIMVLMLALLLTIFVVGAAAQDETPTTDLPDYEIVSVEVGPTSTTTTVNIFANKDTFISSTFPDSNYGGLPTTETRVGRDAAYGAVRILMQFDLNLIPTNSYINNATLNFYQSGYTPTNPPDSPYTIQARYLASDWNEYAVTWNNHKPAWGDVVGTNDVSIGIGWHVANVNTVIQEWVNGRPNYGLVLQGSNENEDRSRRFSSRETGNRPFISVNYTQDTDTCPPTAWINDLPAWSTNGFTVSWDGSDCGTPTSGVKDYNVQYRTDGIDWVNWKTNTTDKSSIFNGNHNEVYYFRVQARDNANNTGGWGAIKSTRIDSQAPTSTTISATTIASSGFAFPNFPVSWSAVDGNSGMNKYEVQYHNNQGSDWVGGEFPPSTTNKDFPGGIVGYTYSLRMRATDNAGNSSDWVTINVTVVNDPSSVVLPFSNPITTNTSFQVSWLGFASNPINDYKVYYRVAPSTTWLLWNQYTASTTFDTFDASSLVAGDEVITIQFQVIATANNSLPEEIEQDRVEASIVVDPGDNMSNNTIFLPVIFKN